MGRRAQEIARYAAAREADASASLGVAYEAALKGGQAAVQISAPASAPVTNRAHEASVAAYESYKAADISRDYAHRISDAITDACFQVYTVSNDMAAGMKAFWDRSPEFTNTPEAMKEIMDGFKLCMILVSQHLTAATTSAATAETAADAAAAAAAAAAVSDDAVDGRQCVTQRILMGPCHMFIRLEKGCHSKDPLFGVFMHMVMNALFINHPGDVAFIINWLRETRGMDDEEIRRVKPAWFRGSHVRRKCPPPKKMAAASAGVYHTFKDLCMGNGQHLFRQDGENKMEDVYESCMEHILAGLCSDPPGENMYYEIRRSKTGLPTFRTIRGNSQEGFHLPLRLFMPGHHVSPQPIFEGFHLPLRLFMPGHHVSPQLADAITLPFVFSWNQRAAETTLGAHRFGFYTLELIDQVQDLESKLHNNMPFPQWIRTPQLSASELEEFGAGRQLTHDLCLDDAAAAKLVAEDDDEEDAEDALGGLLGLQDLDVDLEGAMRRVADLAVERVEVQPMADDARGLGRKTAASCAAPPISAPLRSLPAGISTARVSAAEYLRDKHQLPRSILPVGCSDKSITLFLELLPDFLPSGRRTTIDYASFCNAFNAAVLNQPTAQDGANLTCVSWLKSFCEAYAKRYATKNTVKPHLEDIKALWRELASSAADVTDWDAAAAPLPQLLHHQDCGGLKGASLETMPLELGRRAATAGGTCMRHLGNHGRSVCRRLCQTTWMAHRAAADCCYTA